jgi:hypothetical protein
VPLVTESGDTYLAAITDGELVTVYRETIFATLNPDISDDERAAALIELGQVIDEFAERMIPMPSVLPSYVQPAVFYPF